MIIVMALALSIDGEDFVVERKVIKVEELGRGWWRWWCTVVIV